MKRETTESTWLKAVLAPLILPLLFLSTGCSPDTPPPPSQNIQAAQLIDEVPPTVVAAETGEEDEETESNLAETPTDARAAEAVISAQFPGSGPATNSPPPPTTNQAAAASTAPPADAPPPEVTSSNTTSVVQDTGGETNSTGNIQLSFKGANIEMVVQWLAKNTGKSVVKHPRVNCQLTIVSSKELPPRDAINLVYRALSLEGFTTIESSNSILIVPEGQEPKMSPEMTAANGDAIPDGRQRLLKVFDIRHVPAAELKERIKGVLSEKATVEVDERGNKLIVTDYTENIRLLGELIPSLDTLSPSDTTIEMFTLKHLDAEELASLLNLVLNDLPGAPAAPRSSTSSSRSRSRTPSYSSPFIIRSPSYSSSSSPSTPSTGTAPAPDAPIKLWPDRASNRLIVSAPQTRMPEIKELIARLDVQKPADVEIRVLPLRYVSAVDLVEDIAPLYERLSGQSMKDVIEVTANERSNSLIVLSSEPNFLAIRNLIAELDTEKAEQTTLKVFPLENADAGDVAEQLRELNQDGASTARYVYYYYPQMAGGNQSTTFTADRRRNAVIVQASAAAMVGIAEMIGILDEPLTDNTLTPRIIPLKYVSAVDIEEVLNELFVKEEEDRTYWNPYSIYGQSNTRDNDGVGKLYGKVRITSEPYSNAIIVTSNSPENFDAVAAIIRQLDTPSQAGDSTLRIGLKFAEAVPVANSLNILFARGGSPPMRPVNQQPQQPQPRNPQQPENNTPSGFQLERETTDESYYPWLGGQPENFRNADGTMTMRPASDLVGRVRVVPDTRGNALLVTANVHFFPQVLKLINELDAPTAQVLIEAKIIEVSTDFRDRLGVRFSPDGSRTFDADDFDGSIMPSASADFIKIFTGTPDPAELDAGVIQGDVNLDLLIQFLRKNTDATVLAEPLINVSDNELGRLFVGSQVPFISSSLNTQEGGRNDSFQYKDVGIILEVTPHINNSEEVSLKIHAESSNIRSGETLFGGAILDTRNFHTDLLVKNGQTIVLGGIIQREEADTVRKVPLLGSIPILGWAFKKKDTISRNVELMVFLQPRITRTPEEAQRLMEEVERKSPRLREWQEEEDAQSLEKQDR